MPSLNTVKIGKNSFFIGENIYLGEHVSIGPNVLIRARSLELKDYVTIGANSEFQVADKLVINRCGYIGSESTFVANQIILGEYLYSDAKVVVGHGGKFNYDSRLHVGDGVMLCAYSKINTNYAVTLGDSVGIGEYVDIWTHGSYLDILDGFPSQFGPVKVGSNVWIPAKSTVMPNVNIGDNVVIAANSVVTKDLPSGALCGGIPAKVIRENIYPIKLSVEEKQHMVSELIREYHQLMEYKGISSNVFYCSERMQIKVNKAIFDLGKRVISGEVDNLIEDFRDFLRRRGIKFFTGKPFSSITPECHAKLLALNDPRL
jgi:acetyltransferase-like isoleucine patch superfamily enzyme